ncbi:MAG: hypothetical protein IPL88_10030 [Rhizobiales bacterium]|nr:hypothetical protein [Hyphomicrobiales bacterium]
MPLTSKLFKGDVRLEDCLVRDPAHVQFGDHGDYVGKIQEALMLIGYMIAADELAADRFGPSTREAVLRYKTDRNIVNPAYQTRPDAIVGKMTIARLDQEMAEFEKRKSPPGPADPKLSFKTIAALSQCRARLEEMEPAHIQIEKDALRNTFQVDGSVKAEDGFAYYCGFVQTMTTHDVVGKYARKEGGKTDWEFYAELPPLPIRDHGKTPPAKDNWQSGDVQLVGSDMYDTPTTSARNPITLRHGDSPRFRFPMHFRDAEGYQDDPQIKLRSFVFHLEFATWLAVKDGVSPVVVFPEDLTFLHHWRWKVRLVGAVQYIQGKAIVRLEENVATMLADADGPGMLRPLLTPPDANGSAQRMWRQP